jgi:hypothetical protein
MIYDQFLYHEGLLSSAAGAETYSAVGTVVVKKQLLISPIVYHARVSLSKLSCIKAKLVIRRRILSSAV